MNEYVIYSNIHKGNFAFSVACLDRFDNIAFLHKSSNISIGASYSEYCPPCKRAFLSLSYCYTGNITYQLNGKTYNVREGELIIYGRGCVVQQSAAKGGNVSYTLAVNPQFCKQYGFCDDMICRITDDKLKKLFLKALQAYDDGANTAETLILQLLMHINYHYKKYSSGISVENTLSDKQMAKVIKYINRNIFNKIHLKDLANAVGFTPSYFSYLFKNTCGYSPVSYVSFLRCRNARQLLLTTDFSIKDVMDICGFYSITQFKKAYKKITGRDAEHDAKTPPVVVPLK